MSAYYFLPLLQQTLPAVPDFGLGKIGNCLGPGGAWGPDLGPDLGPGKTSEILIELMNECIFISVTTTQLLQVEEQSIQKQNKNEKLKQGRSQGVAREPGPLYEARTPCNKLGAALLPPGKYVSTIGAIAAMDGFHTRD